MPIHTFGDSHSYFACDGIEQHILGPLLCYSFGKDKLERCDIRNFNIKDGDTIIFCLGEIDCRCHIHKHINETSSYKEIIDDIVDNYMEAIKLNIMMAGISLKHVCVYNVVPPVHRDSTIGNIAFPFLGTDEERKLYVNYFNEKLREACVKNNYIFFDIYDKYTDSDGFLQKTLSDRSVHIRDNIHIKNFIYENNL